MPVATVSGATGPISITFQYENYAALTEALAGQTVFGEYSVGGALSPASAYSVFDAPAGAPTTVADDTTGASGQIDLVQQNTILDFYSAAGSGTIIAGGGMDTYSLGSGNWDVMTGGPSGSLVSLGSGMDTVTTGGSDTILASTGSTLVFDVAGGATIVGTSGPLTYVANPGAASTIDGGSGGATIFGNLSTDTTYVGAASGLFVSGLGRETLNAAGSTGNNNFFLGTGVAGVDVAIGGSGSDYFQSAAGSNTLTGGGGANMFDFSHSTGAFSDVITDFSSSDFLNLSGEGAHQAVMGANDVITLSDNTTITILNSGTISGSHLIG